jgi:hypothetical protein
MMKKADEIKSERVPKQDTELRFSDENPSFQEEVIKNEPLDRSGFEPLEDPVEKRLEDKREELDKLLGGKRLAGQGGRYEKIRWRQPNETFQLLLSEAEEQIASGQASAKEIYQSVTEGYQGDIKSKEFVPVLDALNKIIKSELMIKRAEGTSGAEGMVQGAQETIQKLKNQDYNKKG